MNNLANGSLVVLLKSRISMNDYFDVVYQLITSIWRQQKEGRQVVLDLNSMNIKDGKLLYNVKAEDAVYQVTAIRDFVKKLTTQCVFREEQQLSDITRFMKTMDSVSEMNFYSSMIQFCEKELGIETATDTSGYQQSPAPVYQQTENGETGVLEEGFWTRLEAQYNSQPRYNGQPQQNSQPRYNSQAQYDSQTQYNTPYQQSASADEFKGNGETEVLDASYWQQIAGGAGQARMQTARLIHAKTNKIVVINKDNFWVGKGEVDLKIDKDIVSRRHAQIITRQNHYFISDNDSTNKTFVDGKEIPAKASIEIFNGTHIKFANEEYIFQV